MQKFVNRHGPLIARYTVLTVFIVQFIISIIILSGNSSSASLVLTIPRIFASLISSLFIISLLKTLFSQTLQILVVKSLAWASILCRIVTIILLQYYVYNPSQQCFVSGQVSFTLLYMDCSAAFVVIVLAAQYLRVLKSKVFMLNDSN